MPNFEIAAGVIAAYLMGSISSAILVCKVMGLPDPRTQGSRNPGATNVLRIGGKKAAAITLLGDLLKGVIPVVIAKGWGFGSEGLALVAFAAFLGHLYPVYFRFEGGKGVATALGCLLALNWPTGLCWMAAWGATAALSRYSSLSSLTASLLAPVFIWIFTANTAWTLTVAVMTLILFFRHRSNILKLINGEESRIGRKNR
ncbi:putative glycerol-3-phosphate acyltransferase [Aquicella siphonis]|uniref:Glycerol-3-phosphate acyltransferase n=1 Tax=Aquicella siphonis TaxID=254247 RepID=A0A5E4PFB3_9COXI|nr:glycerol-3-phosphate 1-O-acyltransferase PlsY [Aquicella siphonis]VVC75026.1 putative glycerol-3-phosphate acyltransferase [Aquicella siphonis]